MAKYVIDYGHCLRGADTGAGANGYREEVMTREIGRLVVQKLRKLGHEVYEIDLQSANSLRESLNYRINRINSINPNLSVSIHINAGGGNGSEILTDGYNSDIANRILSNFVALGYRNRGIKTGSDLAVVAGVKPYAMLVECCFIDTNDMNLYNPEKFANAIVQGMTGQIINSDNSSSNNIDSEKVEYDMKYLITYGNEIDARCIDYLADALKCATVNADRLYDYQKVETLVAIGGVPKSTGKFSGYTKYWIKGDDRFSTAKRIVQAAEEITKGKSVEEALLQYKI